MPWFRSVLASLWRSFLFCRLKLLYPVAMRIVAVIAAFAAAQASFLESTGPGPLDLTKLAWHDPTGPSGPTEKELRYWFVLLKMVLSWSFMPSPVWHRYEIRIFCGDVRGHTCCQFGRRCQASNRSCRARFARHACSLLAFGGMFSNVWWLICCLRGYLLVPPFYIEWYILIYVCIYVFIYLFKYNISFVVLAGDLVGTMYSV